MKIIVLLAVVGAALTVPIDYYTTADDNLDMKAVVSDSAKLKAMTDCFLDRGDCDEVTMSYKKILPDSMEHSCTRCNDAQKHLATTYINGLLSNAPADYDSFLKKFDPDEIYRTKFMEAVKGF
ncbi:ejaculatory bulb-specific protein 3-like [Pieris brassicae]|uniref:Chemosensory protein n=1 Tax=Pieris brassicae TaxID=7116 RepID=A0A9P0TL12_PIEBR|nr:ejaculatory bulb-specific protein 3-like [Pieris brassicae]XP_045522951.1 ejaculatory bulb-specific protein 3-like [Pieris brassicae]XP_045522952.1 ejaculatory bulb-specific protein 3-like [Pieris brassicae]XP_045523513.1 ejaculatory bulb-specific protein 3-like [Pieris brassicae]XP_045523514.1 ejaculatory bulb-specific protein 3-like [Pieris brassicae]XP_045523515.1 ejaculatory bulb-specific protein 3-like [Pieris brassicae]XP_045523516.1 ejaculatory bulb-specific protein 3-like [Pieris b